MDRSEQESFARNMARAAELDARKARIRDLNDHLRRFRTGGRLVLACGIGRFSHAEILELLEEIARFDGFTGDNNPYGEHDFGVLDFRGQRIFWKIDYYDKQLEFGSPDPADPEVTARVLTVMLAEEY